MNKNGFELAKWIPICIIAVLLMIIYKTLDNFSQITTALSKFFQVISPLLYGVLFAYFLYIPQQKFQSMYGRPKAEVFSKRARALSILTIFVLLVLIVAIIISFVLPVIIKSIIDFAGNIPKYVNQIIDYIGNLPEDSVWYRMNIADTLRESSGNFINQ
jgi:predicted PurR-regulated permease PerM